MIRKRLRKKAEDSWKEIVSTIQERFKKRFGRKPLPGEIKKVWSDWLELYVLKNVLTGEKVRIDTHSSIRLVGMPIESDKRFYTMAMNGRCITKNGFVTYTRFSNRRRDVKFELRYENTKPRHRVFFKSDPWFSGKIHWYLSNTSNYFKLENERL